MPPHETERLGQILMGWLEAERRQRVFCIISKDWLPKNRKLQGLTYLGFVNEFASLIFVGLLRLHLPKS